jgi:hypothetical protein
MNQGSGCYLLLVIFHLFFNRFSRHPMDVRYNPIVDISGKNLKEDAPTLFHELCGFFHSH